jgi:glycerophosphoryl diester phosphodiesterase
MSDLPSWLGASQDDEEHTLAVRYAPILCFDRSEPFYPLAAGYTIFRQSGPSPSFRQGHRVELVRDGAPPAHLGIEYAIWWDWDIGHLYELEHVWVYVHLSGRVVRCEASWHGDQHDMRLAGKLALQEDRPVLYSEPGKHAFAPTPDWFAERRRKFKRSETGTLAGAGGVLMTRFVRNQVHPTPRDHRLAHSYLAQRAFEPSWAFDRRHRFAPEELVPWPALAEWMPGRVNHWLARLAREISPDQYRFLRIGHRGAAAHAPDNSLSGLGKAADLGADMVEIDLQRTADGHVVLAHDAWLTDDAGRVWPVRQSTLDQLQAIDLGCGERIPTLDQALGLCQGEQLGAYIEIKDGAVLPLLGAALDRHHMSGHTIVASFRADWVADCQSLVPGVATSILFSSTHLDAVELAQAIGAQYVHPCWERLPDPSALLTPKWIARVRGAGLGIICWHEERPEQIAALRRLGIDGICSDAPELLLDPHSQSSNTKRSIA